MNSFREPVRLVRHKSCEHVHTFHIPSPRGADWPEREEDAVTDEDPEAPDDGEAEADVAEVLVGSGEEVPGGQLLGGKALRHLVVHDALQTLLAEVEGVTQSKLPAGQGPRALQWPHLFLHRAPRSLNDPWDTITEHVSARQKVTRSTNAGLLWI